MKRSEFIAKLVELTGEDDVEIYFDSRGEATFTGGFRIILDSDGDIVIQP